MPRTKNPNSKSAFILSQPANLSATEIVAKAKAAGLKISAGYVHTIRYKAKGSSGPKRKLGRPKGSANKPVAVSHSNGAVDRMILIAVAEHGASAVQAALNAATAKIRSLV